MNLRERKPRRSARGVSLVGLLLVVVVLGLLTATAITALPSITYSTITESSPRSAAAGVATSNLAGRISGGGMANVSGVRNSPACSATADAARSAVTLYFATRGGSSYPVRWSDLTNSTPPIYKLSSNVVINVANPKELDGRGWKLLIVGGGGTAPTFTCG